MISRNNFFATPNRKANSINLALRLNLSRKYTRLMPTPEEVNSLEIENDQAVLDSLRVIQVAIDPASPLCGKVDLDFILKLPQHTIREIYDALTDEERQALKTLYGENNENRNQT